MAEMIRGASGDAEEEKEDEARGCRAKDHRLDFGLFNTMLARC
jgi:hypothetical protein